MCCAGEVRHMRNVTVQCAEESEILRELEILEPSEDPSTAWSWVIVGLITGVLLSTPFFLSFDTFFRDSGGAAALQIEG